MTVVKIKISLLLQNHQHSTIPLVMCNDHERHSGPHYSRGQKFSKNLSRNHY